MADHRQNFRKQLVPVNFHQDSILNQIPIQQAVDFIYTFLRQIVKENKPIEIEGKLGRFKSKSFKDQKENEIRLDTLNRISQSSLIMMKPVQDLFSFESGIQIKDYQNQIKFFDMLNEILQARKNQNPNESDGSQNQFFQQYCGISDIIDFESFSCCQNDIVVDFSFEDGTRLKVPLNVDDPIVLDKKNRDSSNNLDFIFNTKHYRISAREETVIDDLNEINKKKLEVREGKYLSVRLKYRKAYRYLFMEYAFTRVFSFQNFSSKKVIEGDQQFIQQIFVEFNKNVGSCILNRKAFSKSAQLFFQKSFSVSYNAITKFESEIEIKDVKKYFKKEFKDENHAQIQSHIRSFVRNIIYLNSISDFFIGMYEKQLKELKNQKNIELPTYFRDGILGQYMESHLFQQN